MNNGWRLALIYALLAIAAALRDMPNVSAAFSTAAVIFASLAVVLPAEKPRVPPEVPHGQ